MIASGQGDFNKYLIHAILCFATNSYEESEKHLNGTKKQRT